VPGDPHSLVWLDDGTSGGVFGGGPPRATPWSGWPAEWMTPSWYNRRDELTDIAWKCVDLNASVISIMPPYFVGDPVAANWIENPDPDRYNSWIDFAKALWWDYQLGEAFVMATAYSGGRPARFHVVAPWMVNVEMVGPFRRYTIGSLDVTSDIRHIPYQICDGEAHGHGPLDAGRYRVLAANLLTRYATNVAASGGIPNSVLKHPEKLTAQQSSSLQEQWVAARQSTMGLPAVLSGGLEFETLQFSPEQMALVDLAKMNEARIAVMMSVPPFLVGLPQGGDSMTYSNVQSIFEYHWRAGLSTMATTVIRALSGWLLPAGTALEVNRDEYVKPTMLERAQAEQIYVAMGALSPEAVAEIERFSVAAPSTTFTSGVLQ
jgi:HK97 family phage portal protein